MATRIVPHVDGGGSIASFDNLSTEILSLILTSLAIPKDPSGTFHPEKFNEIHYALLNVAVCSKRLHDLALPLIHREYNEQEVYPPSDIRQPQLFLQRVLRRPDLARHVKRYAATVVNFSRPETSAPVQDGEEESYLDVGIFTEDDWVLIKEAVRRIVPEDDKVSPLWNVEKGSWEAMTALILSLLPNLEEIAFNGWGHDDVPSLLYVFEKAAAFQKNGDALLSNSGGEALHDAGREEKGERKKTYPASAALLKLRKASLAYWDTEGGMDASELNPFLILRSMRSVNGHMICSTDEDDDGDTEGEEEEVEDEDEDEDQEDQGEDTIQSQSVSQITHLNLNYSVVDASNLYAILKDLPKLKSFRYDDAGATVSQYSGGGEFLAPKFLKSLKLVQKTLENLEISCDDEGGMGFKVLELYPLGFLTSFTALKTLTLPWAVFFGAFDSEEDAMGFDDYDLTKTTYAKYPKTMTFSAGLPPNIEELTLTGIPSEGVQDELFDLSACIKKFPRLRKLNIGWFAYVDDTDADADASSSSPAASAPKVTSPSRSEDSLKPFTAPYYPITQRPPSHPEGHGGIPDVHEAHKFLSYMNSAGVHVVVAEAQRPYDWAHGGGGIVGFGQVAEEGSGNGLGNGEGDSDGDGDEDGDEND